MKIYSVKDFKRLLINNGYHEDNSCRGKHQIFTNGVNRIPITTGNKANEMSGVTTTRIIKKYNLKED